MSFKKAVFFGGAVLVLAACGDATSPTSPSALSSMNGSASVKPTDSNTITTTTTTTAVPLSSPENSICGNATIHLGEDGSIIILCEPTEGQ